MRPQTSGSHETSKGRLKSLLFVLTPATCEISLPDVQTRGFECTIAVASLDQTEALLRKRGANIVLERCTIPQVGHLLFFEDPGGNLVGAMEFDRSSE